MSQFEYQEQLSKLLVPEVISAIGDMREHRGRQALYEATRPSCVTTSSTSSAPLLNTRSWTTISP